MATDLNTLNEYGVPLHACNGYRCDEHYWKWLEAIRLRMTPRRMAPWPDFAGDAIREGSIIQHPVSGEQGKVLFMDGDCSTDQWRVRYDSGPVARLCLQIGDKGQAVVVVP